MTAFVHIPLTLTVSEPGPHTVRIGLRGDLDYTSAGDFMDTAVAALTGHAGLCELRLDCGELELCDSSGLSTLLVIHRMATAADVRVFLERRGPGLERLLQISGVREHLTGEPDAPHRRTGRN